MEHSLWLDFVASYGTGAEAPFYFVLGQRPEGRFSSGSRFRRECPIFAMKLRNGAFATFDWLMEKAGLERVRPFVFQ